MSHNTLFVSELGENWLTTITKILKTFLSLIMRHALTLILSLYNIFNELGPNFSISSSDSILCYDTIMHILVYTPFVGNRPSSAYSSQGPMSIGLRYSCG